MITYVAKSKQHVKYTFVPKVAESIDYLLPRCFLLKEQTYSTRLSTLPKRTKRFVAVGFSQHLHRTARPSSVRRLGKLFLQTRIAPAHRKVGLLTRAAPVFSLAMPFRAAALLPCSCSLVPLQITQTSRRYVAGDNDVTVSRNLFRFCFGCWQV